MEGTLTGQSGLRFPNAVCFFFPNAQQRSPRRRPRPRRPQRPPRNRCSPSPPRRGPAAPQPQRTVGDGRLRAIGPSCPIGLSCPSGPCCRGPLRRGRPRPPGPAGLRCPSCQAPPGSSWRRARLGLPQAQACLGGVCRGAWMARPGAGPYPAQKALRAHQVKPRAAGGGVRGSPRTSA